VKYSLQIENDDRIIYYERDVSTNSIVDVIGKLTSCKNIPVQHLHDIAKIAIGSDGLIFCGLHFSLIRE